MKKSAIIIDPINSTITITEAYYKKACTYGTSEYYEFRKVLKENQGFDVVRKKSNKRTYKNLTFQVMEDYINTQPNSKEMLITFEAVKKIAKAKNSEYPLTKKWFLKNYPEYKENEIQKKESAELEQKLKKELEEKLNRELAELADVA